MRFALRVLLLVCLGALLVASLSPLVRVSAAVVTITPSTVDTYLSHNIQDRDTNYGNWQLAVNPGNDPGYYGATLLRSLVKFDLSSMPAASIINSAHLQLYCSGFGWNTATPPYGETLTVYRITEDWAEMEATWNNRFTSPSNQPWTPSPGGTWTLSGAASTTIPPTVPGVWMDWTVTDIVKAWIENGQANYGFIIDSSSTLDWSIEFPSSEVYYGVEGHRPILQVDYTPLEGSCRLESVGANPTVGSSFTVDIFIGTVSQSLGSFQILVRFDSTQMTLQSRTITVPNGLNWLVGSGHDTIGSNYYDLWMYSTSQGNNVPVGTNGWVTLTFQCIAEGTSPMIFETALLWNGYGAQAFGTGPIDPVQTSLLQVEQDPRAAPPSDPYHYVGGEVFSANKLAVLSPYLTLIGLAGIVVSSAVLVKRRKF